MFTWIAGKLYKIITTTIKVVIQFAKETIVHAPAVAVMTFAGIGIAGILTSAGTVAALTPIAIINETAAVAVISAAIVMSLSTLAGTIAERVENAY